jgi:diguanylate cyclase (GGDEF)-like protein
VQELLDRLRPRLPLRDSGRGATRSDLESLIACTDTDALSTLVHRLALAQRGCRGARLALERVAPDPDVAGRVVLPIAGGRARLELDFDPSTDVDADAFAWIDLVDLRLRRRVEQAQRRHHLQLALFSIADLVHADLALHEMLARVHRVVCDLTYAENFYLVLYDEASDTMRFVYDADVTSAPITRVSGPIRAQDFPCSLTFAVLHGGRSLLGPSRRLREELGLHGDDARLGPDCVDWLGVPMLEGERVRGAVVVQSYDEARRYSEDDRALLGYVAQHILSAVMRKQAHEQLEAAVERRTLELEATNRDLRIEMQERERSQKLQTALFQIVELAAGGGGLDDFFAGVHRVVGELIDARNFFIAQLSEDGEELSFPYFRDEQDTPLQVRRLTHGITERVLVARRPLLATATQIQALIDSGEMVMFGTLPACWLGVPLLQDGRAVGAMVVQSYTDEQAYTAQDQDILQFASFHIATALERKQHQARLRAAYVDLEQRVEERTQALKLANADLREQIAVRERAESRLQHEAMHDALTGLPNRSALLLRLERALAHYRANPARLFAVLFLDLDRFKVVNDSVGHLVGDDLLIEVSRRLSRCLRTPDSVARLGGDEFTVLLEDIRGVEDACGAADRILAALVDPVRIGDKEIYTSTSIGIALAHPRYDRAELLLRDADVAMYRAKSRGRQRYELFDQQLHEEALAVLDLESDLRRAIARQEFEPYLQPIVRLGDGTVLGYEALLRWRHATRGLLGPSGFLAIAEDNGTIEQIDWLLYEQVLRAIPHLREADAYVGINVSARHFRSGDLADTLLRMLERFRVAPARLRIEITEGALLENPAQARATILQLRDAGVLTALDDFGTGYSSLSYLHRFPLHALKIDRSFVAELRPDLAGSSAAVVRAIRALATSLGMELIAEGIETPQQREALLALECGLGQGFLFDPPRAANEVLRRIA